MTLKLICREQAAFELALQTQIELFESTNPGIKVECTFLPIHDHYEKMVEGNGCLTGEFDLFLACTDWLPSLIEQDKLVAIDEFFSAGKPQDWPEGWHPAMLKLVFDINHRLFGIPWHDGPEVLHYRSDLFEDHSNREAFYNEYGNELKPPTNWDEFLETAKFFTRPTEGLWGCCEAAYTDGHNNVYDFLIQLWSRGGVLIDEDLKPQFHSSVGVEALQFYVDLFHLHKVAPLECLDLGSVECGDFYASGKAAMSWNWIGFAATCELPPSKIIGSNRCTRIPAGVGPKGESVSLNIYWAVTIPSGSVNQEAAYRFLKFLSSKHCDKITSLCGANGVRLSTWRDAEILQKFSYYGVIEEVHKSTKTLPAFPEYGEINEAISRAVHRAVRLEMPVEPSLKIAAAEVADILLS